MVVISQRMSYDYRHIYFVENIFLIHNRNCIKENVIIDLFKQIIEYL